MRSSLLLLKIIGKAALHFSGVGGLWSMVVEDVPELADHVMEEWARLRHPAERRDDYEALAGSDDLDVEAVLAEIARDEPEPVQVGLTAYLRGLPGSVRRTLRRPDDPTGRSVPDALVPRSAAELVPALEPRVVQFHVGDRPLPGVPWELVEHLGTGGFGEVWKARHFELEDMEPVALKFCTDPAAREQLLKHEAKLCVRVMSQGRHEGIVALRQAYLKADPPCLEYEYVSGGTLANLIKEWHGGDTSGVPEKAVRTIRAIAEAVAFAHRIDPPIVHRDLKPANILVGRTDRGLRLKVGDFGIGGIASDRAVREIRAGSRPGLLLSRSVGGSYTPLYASPEQIRGGKPDPRDDVHALGVIFFQMLTGNLAHGAPSAGKAWRRRLASLGFAEPLIDVLESCFEPVEDRLADAGALLEAIDGAIPAKKVPPEAATPPSEPQ